VVVGRINGVAALTGFSYNYWENPWAFRRDKKSVRNNEVTVRRGSSVLSTLYYVAFIVLPSKINDSLVFKKNSAIIMHSISILPRETD